MALALTVFGVSYEGAPAVFCYAFFRDVRGSGIYPSPNIPKGKRTNGISRKAIQHFEGLELVCWDKTLDEAEVASVLAEFSSGQMPTLKNCPIEGIAALAGVRCEPTLVQEGRDWVRSSGTGMLWCESIAFEDAIEAIAVTLTQWLGSGKAAHAMQSLVDCIAEQSGLGEIFRKQQRISLADRFFRAEGDDAYGPLLAMRPEKPNFRTQDPMRRCAIVRHFAALDRRFTIHVTAANFDEVLKDCVLEFPSGESEVVIETDSHITDMTIKAFNQDGTLAQRLRCGFVQGMQFGISALGRSDLLPKIKGTPDAIDLQKRTRRGTVAFSGPSVGSRSGGFDIVRDNRRRIAALIGDEKWKPEMLWFERGGNGQLGAIRWIKEQLEKPGISKAYLVDPFLGTDALQRVIARQGNENIELKILISPARVDPDAEELDVIAVEDHCKKLVDAANEWADKLCGDIKIFEIRRGENRRQAFHDRYLVVIDANDIPRTYLLSNSLNKAAGDWAFAICELDRIMSSRVRSYVEDLLNGKDGDRALEAGLIWKSTRPDGPTYAEPEPTAVQTHWVAEAETFLERLWQAAARHSAGDGIEIVCDEFLAAWPEGINPRILAENIYQHLSYREHYVVRVSARFAAAGAAQPSDVAAKLDELLLKDFLKCLPRETQKPNCGWIYTDGRDGLVRHLGQTIERLGNSTYFVRDQLNPSSTT
jgi:hypothetical protein